MNKQLIKDALYAQADAHLSEAYSQINSNVLRPALVTALHPYLGSDIDEGMLDDLERAAHECALKAMVEQDKSTKLRMEASQL